MYVLDITLYIRYVLQSIHIELQVYTYLVHERN